MPRLLKPGQLTGVVEITDDLVATAQDRGDVQLAGGGLRGAGNPASLGERLRGAQQRLRGHARVVRALATDQTGLDDRHGVALLGQPAGEHLAGRAGSDHDHIICLRVHPISFRALCHTHRPTPGGSGSTTDAEHLGFTLRDRVAA